MTATVSEMASPICIIVKHLPFLVFGDFLGVTMLSVALATILIVGELAKSGVLLIAIVLAPLKVCIV